MAIAADSMERTSAGCERRPGALASAAIAMRRWQRLAVLVGLALLPAAEHRAGERLYGPEGNRLRVYDLDAAPGAPAETAADRARLARPGARARRERHGRARCPDGSGRFVAGEDTGQPAVPAGWGIFGADGTQLGRLTATSFDRELARAVRLRLRRRGPALRRPSSATRASATSNGQLILWFPPLRGRSQRRLLQARRRTSARATRARDRSTRARVRRVRERLRDPALRAALPDLARRRRAAAGSGTPPARRSPTAVQREAFARATSTSGLVTYSRPRASRRAATLYAASVATGRIGEFDLDGTLLRVVLAPAELAAALRRRAHPQGLAVDVACAALLRGPRSRLGGLDARARARTARSGASDFDAAGEPLAPALVRDGLQFPDGLAVLPAE